eukprot:GHVQ01013117.1.p1 GENE.GHVQ01013117.1~~GHVQ01013117.1.p1  ORF type:complete len:538 (+),score=26.13 GHVQ01013117.1:416-2029(+)
MLKLSCFFPVLSLLLVGYGLLFHFCVATSFLKPLQPASCWVSFKRHTSFRCRHSFVSTTTQSVRLGNCIGPSRDLWLRAFVSAYLLRQPTDIVAIAFDAWRKGLRRSNPAGIRCRTVDDRVRGMWNRRHCAAIGTSDRSEDDTEGGMEGSSDEVSSGESDGDETEGWGRRLCTCRERGLRDSVKGRIQYNNIQNFWKHDDIMGNFKLVRGAHGFSGTLGARPRDGIVDCSRKVQPLRELRQSPRGSKTTRLYSVNKKPEYVFSPPGEVQPDIYDSQFPEDLEQIQLITEKVRMSHIFSPDGHGESITILRVLPATIIAFRAFGYCDVAYGKTLSSKKFIPRHQLGRLQHYVGAAESQIRSIKLRPPHLYVPGQILDARCLIGARKVAVTGITKGKGFCGVMQRHGFKGGPAWHGSSFHRTGGSIGDSGRQRVLPGTKMAGKVGNDQRMVFGMWVLGVNPVSNEIMVKGSVPGNKKGEVIVTRFMLEENNDRRYPITKNNGRILWRKGTPAVERDEDERIRRLQQRLVAMRRDGKVWP